MGYQYDIFISYRRLGATRKWINDIFLPILSDIVSLELGRNPTHFLDTQLEKEAGAAWPLSLGEAISQSKVIIPLWSVSYLESLWCKCEISHMLAREVKTGFKTVTNKEGLVFPTIIHDGQTLPINLSLAQKIDIVNFYVPFMDVNSKSAEELYRLLRPYGVSMARSILNAPTWQQDWGIEAKNEFFKLFNDMAVPQQDQVPKYSSL